jgi:CobQ-like glutamine amidotransferase family enzyme
VPADSVVGIGLLLPDLLGTYGDTGNSRVLERRLAWRGIRATVVTCTAADAVPSTCDIYLLGGGEDATQQLAVEHLRAHPGLQRAVGGGGVVLAVCAGLQILGGAFTGIDSRRRAGLGLLDLVTVPLPRRAVGEVVARPATALLASPLSGFENHRGGSRLGPAATPLARVTRGVGNGTRDRAARRRWRPHPG